MSSFAAALLVREAGVEPILQMTVAAEMVARLRDLGGVQGVHLFAIEWPEVIARTVERAGVTPPA